MPIYEFLCPDCNTIYSFFSRSVNTDKAPSCPRSPQHALQKKVSMFAVRGKAKGKEKGEGDEPGLPIDESKMEKAMEALAGEAENISEDNPRDAAKLMRKLSDMTGLHYGDTMQEALRRMESGEDPEKIEEEMGDLMNTENPEDLFVLPDKKGKKSGTKPAPKRDDTLYEM
jgi:putative FmdB family regulatory protein